MNLLKHVAFWVTFDVPYTGKYLQCQWPCVLMLVFCSFWYLVKDINHLFESYQQSTDVPYLSTADANLKQQGARL
jgi:hypothetical protein